MFGSKRLHGKVVGTRPFFGASRIIVEVKDSYIRRLFTGKPELTRLEGQDVSLTMKVVDTKGEEREQLRKQVKESRKKEKKAA